jgi:hypothetical protein
MKQGDQIILRTRMRNGDNLIRLGTVVSIHSSKATVFIPADNVRKTVPLNSLELASSRFGGRARVEINPVRRRIG